MKLDIFEVAHRRLEYLKKIAGMIREMQTDEPKGQLRISRYKNKTKMYHRYDGSERSGHYIPRSNYALACELAKKGYMEQALQAVEKEEARLKEYIDNCAGKTFENVYETLSTMRQSMIVPLAETDEMLVDRWQDQQFTQKPLGDCPRSYETRRGDIVRSKSELIIADELFYRGIPYRYECKTMIGVIPVYPDFTVLNVARRKTFIWEHLGMLDDPEYADNTATKLNNYMTNDYYPGVNLLLTWETSNTPIKTELVRDIIAKFLLN